MTTAAHPASQQLDDEPLLRWRQSTVVLLVWLFVPLTLFDVINYLWLGRWPAAAFQLGIALLTLGLCLASRHNYRLRGGAILAFFVVSSVAGLVAGGSLASPLSLMLAAAFIAALLFGPWASVGVVALGSASGAVMLGGFGAGLVPYLQPLDTVVWPPLVTGALTVAGIAATLTAISTSLITTFEETQVALAVSQAKYKALFALLPTGVTLANERGQISEVNPAAERLLGISREEHLARRADDTAWDIIQSDGSLFPADAFPVVRAAREGQVVANVEMGVRRPDGRLTWLSVIAAPLPLPRYSAVVTYSEITTYKEAELALSSKLRYAKALAHCSRLLLIEGAEAPAWEPVVQQTITALREAVGCTRLTLRVFPSPDAVLRSPAIILTDQDSSLPPFNDLPVRVADVPPLLWEVILNDGTVAGPLDELFPQGSPINVHGRANGLLSMLASGAKIGGVLRGLLIGSDVAPTWEWDEPTIRLLRTGLEMITVFLNQWETAKALRSREAQLRAVGDNLPGGYIFQLHRDTDRRLRFTYLSSSVEQLLGVRPEDGLHDPDAVTRMLLPEEVAQLDLLGQQAAKSGSDLKEVVRYRAGDGGVRWLYFCARPQQQVDGSAVWDGVALDITERQQVTEELARARDEAEAATRAKSTFLASMSHEIRTPLNAVIGMAALLQDTALSVEQNVFVQTIRSAGEALLTIISDILDFSRIESGHIALDVQAFDLHACLLSAARLVAQSARDKELQLGCTLAPDLPQAVVGDEGRLRQVLLNLLSNAIKFTDRGEVCLSALVEADHGQNTEVIISVADTGIGISDTQLERIFDPFVQAERSTSRRYGGTGLGLTISRQLVDLMGGRLSVTSAPGTGATFTVRLTFQTVAIEALHREEAPTASVSRPLNVLVAEDNEVNQLVIQHMVERLGHRATVVEDGLAALEALAREPYDVVLMDLQMPLLDGAAATRKIRQLVLPVLQPYIIALTANVLSEARERAAQAGIDLVLYKPVDLAKLQQALSRAGEWRRSLDDWSPAVIGQEDTEPLIAWDVLNAMAASMTPIGQEEQEGAALATIFLTAAPRQLSAIEAALAAGEIGQLQRLAHQLGGGCLQIGARAMAALCRTLQYEHSPEATVHLVGQLRICYGNTQALLRQRFALE